MLHITIGTKLRLAGTTSYEEIAVELAQIFPSWAKILAELGLKLNTYYPIWSRIPVFGPETFRKFKDRSPVRKVLCFSAYFCWEGERGKWAKIWGRVGSGRAVGLLFWKKPFTETGPSCSRNPLISDTHNQVGLKCMVQVWFQEMAMWNTEVGNSK